jgi:spore coat protein U-like protein
MINKNNMINKNKKIKAFSTSALTTLLGTLLVFANISTSSAVTSDNTFDASATVGSSCTISASTMTFAAYTETAITATTDVSVNCTFGTAGVVTLSTVSDASTATKYKLIRTSQDGATPADVLEVSFKITSTNAALHNSAGSFSVTGTGAAVTNSAVITGTIAATQTSKTAGTFSKSLTLTVTYT